MTQNKNPKSRAPRTIGTNVGQVIKDALEADEKSRRAKQAAILRKMAGKG